MYFCFNHAPDTDTAAAELFPPKTVIQLDVEAVSVKKEWGLVRSPTMGRPDST